MARKVVASFSDKSSSHFEVEYKDTNNEWIGASGTWDKTSPAVMSMYPDIHGASVAGRFVSRWSGFDTRVVEVT